MSTSSRFVVAVHLLTALTIFEDQTVTSDNLAFSLNTNPTVVRSLLIRLTKAGLTKSQLGTGGGARLAKPASQITLLDVYLAMEDQDLFSCHRNGPSDVCVIGSNILPVLKQSLDTAHDALKAELQRVTITKIARDVAREGKFKIPLDVSQL